MYLSHFLTDKRPIRPTRSLCRIYTQNPYDPASAPFPAVYKEKKQKKKGAKCLGGIVVI